MTDREYQIREDAKAGIIDMATAAQLLGYRVRDGIWVYEPEGEDKCDPTLKDWVITLADQESDVVRGKSEFEVLKERVKELESRLDRGFCHTHPSPEEAKEILQDAIVGVEFRY